MGRGWGTARDRNRNPERERKRGIKRQTDKDRGHSSLDQSKERGWAIGKPLVPCPPTAGVGSVTGGGPGDWRGRLLQGARRTARVPAPWKGTGGGQLLSGQGS